MRYRAGTKAERPMRTLEYISQPEDYQACKLNGHTKDQKESAPEVDEARTETHNVKGTSIALSVLILVPINTNGTHGRLFSNADDTTWESKSPKQMKNIPALPAGVYSCARNIFKKVPGFHSL